MKRIIIITFLMVSKLVRGQGYVPLIDTSRTWNVAQIYPHGGGSENYEYFFGNNVMIEDTLYVEVKAMWFNQSNIKGYMREDTVTGKVYYRNIFAQEPALLYDFSLEEGDTIKLYGHPFSHTVLRVDSIELHNGNVRKRWMFSRNAKQIENLIWIEGIGNITIYLLNPGDSDSSTITTILLCCNENEELVYMNDTYNTCHLNWVNVAERNIETITIFPNPTKDHITISAKPGVKLDVNMYNIQGRLLLRKQIETHYSDISFDLSFLGKGIYLLVLSNRDFQYTTKIIKL